MLETTKTCQEEMLDGKPCGHELYDDERCIFHSDKKDKDLGLFQKRLDEIFKEENLNAYDFTRFIFAKGAVLPKKFNKRVILEEAVFKDKADFDDATFEGRANFGECWFEGEARFSGATFKDLANFCMATFQDATHLDGATFEGKVNFSYAVFNDLANLSGATFKSGAYFVNPAFVKRVLFTGSTFEEALVMNTEAFFNKDKKDEDNKKDKKKNKDKKKKKDKKKNEDEGAFCDVADFTSIKFSTPEKVEFHKVDLSRCRFLNTDVSNVQLTDVVWSHKKGKGRNSAFDEIATKFLKDKNYALIAQLCRRLRANYEKNLRYSEAGDFYIGEMEVTRKAEKNIFKSFPLVFYKAISNYGESYYRPLGWIAAILLIFPLLFMFAGIEPISLDSTNPMEEIIHYKLDFGSTKSF